MALIRCPKCGAWTSDQVSACVQCGVRFSSEAPLPPDVDKASNGEITSAAKPPLLQWAEEPHTRPVTAPAPQPRKGYYVDSRIPDVPVLAKRRRLLPKILWFMVFVSAGAWLFKYYDSNRFIGGPDIVLAPRTGAVYETVLDGAKLWEIRMQLKHKSGGSLHVYVLSKRYNNAGCGSSVARDHAVKKLYQENFRQRFATPWVYAGSLNKIYLFVQNCGSRQAAVSAKLFYREAGS